MLIKYKLKAGVAIDGTTCDSNNFIGTHPKQTSRDTS